MIKIKPNWDRGESKLRRSWQTWREEMAVVSGDSVMSNAITLSLGIVTIGFLIIVLRWSHLPPQIPLYYSLPWGEEQLADKIYLLILPGLGLAVAGFNFIISTLVVKYDIMAGRVLNSASLGVAVLGVYTLLRIVSLLG